MRILTTTEAKDMLGFCDYRYIIKLIKKGKLKAHKHGRAYAITEQEVLNYAKKRGIDTNKI